MWFDWELFKKKGDAEVCAETLDAPEGKRVERLEPGDSGYKEGFRWVVQYRKVVAPA